MAAVVLPIDLDRSRKPDFMVEYRFLRRDEGGRDQLPHQGYCCDLLYEADAGETETHHMILPQFLDADKKVITDTMHRVPASGYAYVQTMRDEMRDLHKAKARIGRRCFFLEGGKPVAESRIVERIGLDLARKELLGITENQRIVRILWITFAAMTAYCLVLAALVLIFNRDTTELLIPGIAWILVIIVVPTIFWLKKRFGINRLWRIIWPLFWLSMAIQVILYLAKYVFGID